MTWQNRLRKTIKLVAPQDGLEFEVHWRGNLRRVVKKLGVFNFARVPGSIVQDLDVGASTYPLTLLFSGPDHDVEAQRFFRACSEQTGKWLITHPVHGRLYLQLVSVSEVNDPTESGNITQISTEWIESIDKRIERLPAQIAADMDVRIDETNETSAEQFENSLASGTFQDKTGVLTTSRNYLDIFNDTILELAGSVVDVRDRISSVYRSVIDTLSQPVINAGILAGQVQQLVQLPALAISDVRTRLNAYNRFIADGLSRIALIQRPFDTERDSIVTHELFLTAALSAIARISVTGLTSTRSEAVATAVEISGRFVEVTDRLDEIQELFEVNQLDLQYFSQLDSFASAAVMIAEAVNYILLTSFDLAIEKRLTLRTWRSPIEIVISEYGGLGDADANLTEFLDANDLTAEEIMLLPPETDVVVYI